MLIIYLLGCLVVLVLIGYLNKYQAGDISLGVTVFWVLLSWATIIALFVFLGYDHLDTIWRMNDTKDT